MSRKNIALALTGLALLVGALAAPHRGRADDRKLFVGFREVPYVFILLDNSASMNWATVCTQEQLDAGFCPLLCPDGGCMPDLAGDDPASRLYQVKEVMYQILFEVDDVDFGFATFNQDDMRVRSKHWMYKAATNGPTLGDTGVAYPAIDDKHVFGRTWPCTSGDSSIRDIGCGGGNDAADLDDAYDARRVQRLPKGGRNLDGSGWGSAPGDVVSVFVAVGNDEFKVEFGIPSSGAPGASLVSVPVTTCELVGGSANCDSGTIQTGSVDFELSNEFLFMDMSDDFGQSNGTRGENDGSLVNYFELDEASDLPMLEGETSSCNGLDLNSDSTDDIFEADYNLRWPTQPGAVHPSLELGDFIPFDWTSNHKTDVLLRLAPNRALGEATPDFTVSRFFEDTETTAVDAHTLRSPAARPILASSATPMYESILDFRTWYAGCTGPGNCSAAEEEASFEFYAKTRDPNWPCRKKYLLILTDGDESCAGGQQACSATGSLESQVDVETFAVAYGVPGGSDLLTCLPANSSDVPALFPQNRQELIDALQLVFDAITGRVATFSAAAVPSVQAESADKLYLSSLAPVPENATWPSRLDAFLKPLPLEEGTNLPDVTLACPDPSTEASNCHLWNAQEEIVLNQTGGADPVGFGSNQRRVFYGEFSDNQVPRTRGTFENFTNRAYGDAEKYDLWRGLDIPFVPGDITSEADAEADTDAIVDTTLAVKTGTLPDETIVNYVVGDVFHSDPLFLTSPINTLAFIEARPDYRDFFFLHEKRRKMLASGSNDGMFHVYDAGAYHDGTDPDFPSSFDDGSGLEVFAFMPRPAMPIVKRLTEDPIEHQFSVDGRPTAADVFIDPIHDSPVDPVDPDDREWHTVILSGMREGAWAVRPGFSDLEGPPATDVQRAAGYFLLDVTWPDPIPEQDPGPPRPPDFGIPEISNPPACLDASTANCGTVPFGAVLWEFTDTIPGVWNPGVDDRPVAVRLDEDANGFIDLGPTWSTANIGRMQVCVAPYTSCDPNVVANSVEDRYVAIFGGGLDGRGEFHARGNWLYIVDVETGETIYKHRLDGAAPSEPAAVDSDFDGYLDRVYMGTTLGFLYRVDLVDAAGLVPRLVPTTVAGQMSDGSVVSVTRDRIVDDPADPDDHAFLPDILFNANDFSVQDVILGVDPNGVVIRPRQMYFRPSVVFIPELDLYGIAIGTGNREDLFDRGDPGGRFFVFVDDVSTTELHDPVTPFAPLTPLDLTNVPLTADPLGIQTSLLTPGTGWWFDLALNQRLVAEPFALSGILFFSTFIPADQAIVFEESICRETGTSQIFATLITNGDGLLFNEASEAVRFIEVQELVSSVFTEQSQTKNPPPPGGIEAVPDNLQDTMEGLKSLFPSNCKFPPGYRIDVKTRTTDTGIVWIAPVPLCVIEKNFKDF
jgi:hypothetical protein